MACLACTFFVIALLISEARGLRAGIWIFKPLASTAFVAAAVGRGALATAYGRWVLAALALSWVGDVLLIPEAQLAFTAGLGAFLLAHVLYGVAFVAQGAALGWAAAAVPVLALIAWPVSRWLLPHVPSELKVPVVAYMIVITAMVALAAGHYGAHQRALVPAAAVAFYFSDLSVARNKFVKPGFDNLTWGLPLYFGAQLLFAATTGKTP